MIRANLTAILSAGRGPALQPEALLSTFMEFVPMIRISTILTIFFVSTFSAVAQDSETRPALADLGWMSGCWKQDRGDGRYVYEQWSKAEGVMVGLGRVHRGGRIVDYEFLRIEEKEGGIYFIAIPARQKEAAFRLTSLKDGTAVFENPKHDFPQKISYTKTDDGMSARVEGSENGKTRGFQTVFTRAACEG